MLLTDRLVPPPLPILRESPDDDDVPTLVFERDARRGQTMKLLPSPRDRWSLASSLLVAQMIRELPRLAPPKHARFPLPETNVFLMPPGRDQPPPPWATIPPALLVRTAPPKPPKRQRRRRSRLPLFAAAMLLAIGIGLWRDQGARASVVSDLTRAREQAAALVGLDTPEAGVAQDGDSARGRSGNVGTRPITERIRSRGSW